ncbi:MAG: PDZ domain-containing protein [Acidipila sp.]|nr:PDZ domain-containing protein [Acidipila sp.]
MTAPATTSIQADILRYFAAAVFCLLSSTCAQATIRYSVSLAQRDQNLFHVSITVPAADRELVLALPVWNALYQVRDFAHRVERLRASDAAGRPLPVIKSDPQTWRVSGSGAITVDYFILWDEPSPFSSDVSANHAFLNFAEVLLYVPSRRSEAVRVDFADVPRSWHIAVALDHAALSDNAAYSFTAQSYDVLVDAPAELGRFDEFTVEAGEIRADVVVHSATTEPGSRPAWSRDRLSDQIRRIITTETALMRDVPFRRFLFIFHVGLGAGGGMEHSNSTAISIESGADPASVIAHEFFHVWNVKRIRPSSLEPVDYSRMQPTAALWFAEGVTSTVGDYTMLRSGLWTREQFYSDLAGQIASLESRPAREWQSAEESSLDAWFEKYPLYHRSAFSISYYNKGQLLGILLDILLREKTANGIGLDDLLRDLNEEYARKGRFYEDSAGIRDAAIKLAGADAAPALEEFFSSYVSGTAPLPMQNYLARAGLELRLVESSIPDLGAMLTGSPAVSPSVEPSISLTIVQVVPGGAAEQAGLRRGDRILTADHRSLPLNFQEWIESRSPGEVIHLRVRRGDDEREFSFALGHRTERSYFVREDPAAKRNSLPGRIRESILTGANGGS